MAADPISGVSPTPFIQQQMAGQVREAVQQNTQTPEADKPGSGPTSTAQDVTRTTDQVQFKSTATVKNLDTVRAIEMLHKRLNEQAKGVRETNEALAQVTERVDQMNAGIQSIIKNYPPFPVDSSQRQEILMSYISLKKEMERLMVPPPPPPIYENVRRMWDSLFAENGQMLSSAVPGLEKNSSDKKLKEAAIGLNRLNEQVTGLSNGMTDALVKGL